MKNEDIALTSLQQELITGLMLGDGHLSKIDKRHKNSRIIINRAQKDEDYAYYIYNNLINISNNPPKIYSEKNNINADKFKITYRSKSLPCITKLRKIWYPYDIKIVPKNLELTPLVLLIWFCDDGNFKTKGKNECVLTLSTHGFSFEEVNNLCHSLNNIVCDGFRVSVDRKKYYIIEASTKPALKFVKLIDKYFNNVMLRKANIWRNDMSHLFYGEWFELSESKIFHTKDLCVNFYKYCVNNSRFKIMQLENDKILNHQTFKKVLPWLIENKFLVRNKNSFEISNDAKKYFITTLEKMQ